MPMKMKALLKNIFQSVAALVYNTHGKSHTETGYVINGTDKMLETTINL